LASVFLDTSGFAMAGNRFAKAGFALADESAALPGADALCDPAGVVSLNMLTACDNAAA